MLRTNPSEDDLCLKEQVDPIIAHKEALNSKSILKIKHSAYNYQIEKVEAGDLVPLAS